MTCVLLCRKMRERNLRTVNNLVNTPNSSDHSQSLRQGATTVDCSVKQRFMKKPVAIFDIRFAVEEDAFSVSVLPSITFRCTRRQFHDGSLLARSGASLADHILQQTIVIPAKKNKKNTDLIERRQHGTSRYVTFKK